MVTYTNPQVGSLQSRIQNLNFGSPNYLTGVNTTTPYFQMGNTMQTYNPQGFNQTTPGDTSSYLGYTPQPYVPSNPQFAQPLPFTTPMTQGGGVSGGGGDGLARFREMQAANAFRDEIKNNPYFDIPDEYKTDLPPGILSFLDTIIGNVPRELAIDRIVRDVDASKDFGVNKYGLGTSYKGSSSIDRDPKGADNKAPTSGVSASDADTGKYFGGTQSAGKQGDGPKGGFGGPSGHGSGKQGGQHGAGGFTGGKDGKNW